MLLLKSPGDLAEAVEQRNFLAQTLHELLVGQGMADPDETLDGRCLVDRAKKAARARRVAIDVAQDGARAFEAVFRGHSYDSRRMFPVLAIAFDASGRFVSSGYGWCPADWKEGLDHARLAGFNDGRLPGASLVDEALEIVLVNLDAHVTGAPGAPIRIAARPGLAPYRAPVIENTPFLY